MYNRYINQKLLKDDYGTIALNYIHNDMKKPIKVFFHMI